MSRVPLLLLLALAAALASPSHAFFQTGNELRRTCSGDVVAYSECVGFLTGVADALKTLRARKKLTDVCVPGGVTSGDLVEAFRAYAAENEAVLEIAASSVAIDAYRARWPC